MRYTRYNYKKKKNNEVGKTVISFLAMSIFVIIVGILLANVIIYFLPLNDANKSENNNSEQIENSDSINSSDATEELQVNSTEQNSDKVQGAINTSFMAIQCGYFSEEDNAKEVFNKISNDYGSFIYKDSDKFKVLAGVYTLEDGQAIMNQLTGVGIKSYEVDFNLDASNSVENQISGILNGYLEILNEAFKDDVKFFDTTDFKSWVSNLDSINEGDKKETLEEVKNHIKEISTEIKKEDVSKEMQYLYETLLNFNK